MVTTKKTQEKPNTSTIKHQKRCQTDEGTEKPVKSVEKPFAEKPITADIDPKTPATAPHSNPSTDKLPEPSASDMKKVNKEVSDGNIQKTEPPKGPKIASGEKEAKSKVLEDDPNLPEKDLDDLKKYEDKVDDSTKKKMKKDADSDVDKGKNHNSKAKALMMARIVAEANDKVDTPIPVLIAELATIKALKGVTGFGHEQGSAPGEFRILMFGSKYDVDPHYTPENTNEHSKEDETFKLRPIEEKEVINDFRKQWPIVL
ncbi:MAG: hypothetical protein ACO1N0_19420 [Fluviicola sp.]